MDSLPSLAANHPLTLDTSDRDRRQELLYWQNRWRPLVASVRRTPPLICTICTESDRICGFGVGWLLWCSGYCDCDAQLRPGLYSTSKVFCLLTAFCKRWLEQFFFPSQIVWHSLEQLIKCTQRRQEGEIWIVGFRGFKGFRIKHLRSSEDLSDRGCNGKHSYYHVHLEGWTAAWCQGSAFLWSLVKPCEVWLLDSATPRDCWDVLRVVESFHYFQHLDWSHLCISSEKPLWLPTWPVPLE